MDKWEKEKKEQVNEVGVLYSHVNNEEMKRIIFKEIRERYMIMKKQLLKDLQQQES